ncbi:MAG: agmatine/peptidylarginine deiminase [Acidobacteriota bacterium]
MNALAPADLGYFMPAEWHRHEATWLAWPKDPITWPDRVPQVESIFAQMIALLSVHERVELLVDDALTEAKVLERVKRLSANLSNVRFHHIPTVDSWIRDYGPNFLLRRQAGATDLAFNHWLFNAWGGKYEELKKDADIPSKIAPLLGVPRFLPGIVLEGGSIDVNGAGTCLTTEQCLLNPNRNPGLSKGEIEGFLKKHLGVSQVIWLGQGIAGDDTDGHIDDIARFVAADTIVCSAEEDPADENYHLLEDNVRRLGKARDAGGNALNIIRLPMPGMVAGTEGRLPASYANFYIANGLVLAPVFGHPKDRRALQILENLFPDRRVVGINCESLVWGLGAIHCVTQQQPARGLTA